MSKSPAKRAKASLKKTKAKKVAAKPRKVAAKKVSKKVSKSVKSKRPLKPARSAKPTAVKLSVKPMDFSSASIKQIVQQLFRYLADCDLDPVLIAHGCAAFYASSVHPKTVEFVISDFTLPALGRVMKAIGFEAEGVTVFTSKRCPVEVVFSPPPMTAGDDVVRDTVTVKTREGNVRMLTETDCVRQLLAMFYRWGDVEAINEAVAVARECRENIDFELIRRWSDWEWCPEKFVEFMNRLNAEPKKGK